MGSRWTVAAGRQIYFDGRPFISVNKEGDTEPVEADGSVHFIVECLNRAGVTPDDIWERHMGHPRRRPKHASEARRRPHLRQPDEDEDYDEDESEPEDEWADFDLRSEMDSGVVIGDARRGGYSVTADGKDVGTFPDFDAAALAAARWMQSNDYHPNVFYVNDRGNVDLLALKPRVIRGKVIKVEHETVKSWV